MTVRILNPWKNPGWKAGDHVEMDEATLKEWLGASAVEVVVDDKIEVKPAVRKEKHGSSRKTMVN